MKTKYMILLAVTALLASCQSEQDPFNLSSNKGSFALNLNSGEIVVNTETRAALTPTEAKDYLITVFQNENEIWEQKRKYSTLTGSDYLLSAGTGYSVYAESCLEEDAETVNDGFGCKRFAGRSDAFAIQPSKTTEVSVNCEATNGGLCVVFDKSFTDVFGRYSVELTGERNLVFDGTNKATFNASGVRTGGAVAYFNMPPSGEMNVELEVHARGAQVTPKTVLVKQGKITRFTVYGPNGGTGDNTGTIDIEIDYDDDYNNEDHPIIID
jgi:hypothetical protein